jgi:hypothetical protein
MCDMTLMTQADLDRAVTPIDMTANSHPYMLVRLSEGFIARALKFYKNTKSAKRTTNGGRYNDVNLFFNPPSAKAPRGSSYLMQAIQLKHKEHHPKNGATNKLILFEEGDRIGFHADSASQVDPECSSRRRRLPRGPLLASGQ